MEIVVIGAGAAGLAAAWAADRQGAQVTLLNGGAGASQLSGGAVDDVPWEELERAEQASGGGVTVSSLSTDATDFAAALGLWRLAEPGAAPARLVTLAGRTRLARGHDRGLLDLQRLPEGARVALPRVPRPEWDADSLARCLNADRYARRRDLRFIPADAAWLRHVGDDRIPAAGFASLFDDDHSWLLARMHELVASYPGAGAILCGPWLGARQALSETLSTKLGVLVGEALASMAGPATTRFLHARQQLLENTSVRLLNQTAQRIRRRHDLLEVSLSEGEPLPAHAVVLAIGGLAGGGIIYQPPFRHDGLDFPPSGQAPFRLSVEVPATLCADGRDLGVVSSIHGPDLDTRAWPKDADAGLLEAVGVRCSGECVTKRVFAAGDVIADRQRTLVAAIESGVRAGRAVCA